MDSKNQIIVKGARQHNLKNISISIPRDKLVVVTGLSGSGKSSLAFDTIYAEGQRRYVESLSSYARQFLGLMEKPDMDSIEGLSPAISIEQKATARNPRSTVGTVTEIHDYFRLLFAHIGKPHCWKCGKLVEKQTVQQIVDTILKFKKGSKIHILAPLVRGRKGEHKSLIDKIRKDGFLRIRINGEVLSVDQKQKLNKNKISLIKEKVVKLKDFPSFGYEGGSGFQCVKIVLRKNEKTMKFAQEWLHYNSIDKCCSLADVKELEKNNHYTEINYKNHVYLKRNGGNLNYWKEGIKKNKRLHGHRHDQSISGLLLNKLKLKLRLKFLLRLPTTVSLPGDHSTAK